MDPCKHGSNFIGETYEGCTKVGRSSQIAQSMTSPLLFVNHIVEVSNLKLSAMISLYVNWSLFMHWQSGENFCTTGENTSPLICDDRPILVHPTYNSKTICVSRCLIWGVSEACPPIFLLFAITVFHTDQQFLWLLVLFLLVKTLLLVTKKNKNILSNTFFSLI